MNCAHHPERDAVGTCAGCACGVCEFCKTVVDGKTYCPSCIEKLVKEENRPRKVEGKGTSDITPTKSAPIGRKRKWKKLLIAILATIGAIAVLLILVCTGVFGTICATQVNPAKAVVDEFMLAGQVHDIDGAYALWEPQAERDKIESLIEDNYQSIFEQYEGLSVSGWFLTTGHGQTFMTLDGSISYTNGSKLHYEAELRKISGEWKLNSFYWRDEGSP